LIEKGCKLDKKIKKLTAELSLIKEEVGKWEKGSYGTEDGYTVNISKQDDFTEPDAKSVYKWFKERKLSDVFFSCVKVQVAAAKKAMGEPAFYKFRKVKGEVTRISFKSISSVEVEASSKETSKSDSDSLPLRLLKL